MKILKAIHELVEQLDFILTRTIPNTSSEPDLLVPYLDGSTETGLATAGSTVAHFTTLRAQKFMKRATRICINFCHSSNYVATRAQSKWLTFRANYCVDAALFRAIFWFGPRKSNLQPYEAS